VDCIQTRIFRSRTVNNDILEHNPMEGAFEQLTAMQNTAALQQALRNANIAGLQGAGLQISRTSAGIWDPNAPSESPKMVRKVESDEQNLASRQTVTNKRSLDGKQVDVFLTHNWGQDVMGRDNHERVGLINAALQRVGITTWFDEERMHGDIVAQMTNGIENARIVVVFVTGEYIKKVGGKGRNGTNDNCKVEFDYSVRRKKADKIITVVMEEACLDTNTWLGAVGAFLGGRLYHNFCHNSMLDSCITDLKDDINSIINEEEIDVDQAC